MQCDCKWQQQSFSNSFLIFLEGTMRRAWFESSMRLCPVATMHWHWPHINNDQWCKDSCFVLLWGSDSVFAAPKKGFPLASAVPKFEASPHASFLPRDFIVMHDWLHAVQNLAPMGLTFSPKSLLIGSFVCGMCDKSTEAKSLHCVFSTSLFSKQVVPSFFFPFHFSFLFEPPKDKDLLDTFKQLPFYSFIHVLLGPIRAGTACNGNWNEFAWLVMMIAVSERKIKNCDLKSHVPIHQFTNLRRQVFGLLTMLHGPHKRKLQFFRTRRRQKSTFLTAKMLPGSLVWWNVPSACLVHHLHFLLSLPHPMECQNPQMTWTLLFSSLLSPSVSF